MNLMQRRRALMAQAAGEDTDLHLNDILTLDGILNTRAGHDASATKWEDISGNNNDFVALGGTASPPLWGENYAGFTANVIRGLKNTSMSLANKSALSIEVVAVVLGNGGTKSGNAYYGIVYKNNTASDNDGIRINSRSEGTYHNINGYYDTKAMSYISCKVPKYICYVISSSGLARYVNGEQDYTDLTGSYRSAAHTTSHYIGANNTGTWTLYGNIYRLGISGSAFSAATVAERYAYFKNRFGL